MGSNKSYTTPMDSRFPQNPEASYINSSYTIGPMIHLVEFLNNLYNIESQMKY